MTMKRFGITALLLSTMALSATGCGVMNMGGGEEGVKMSAEEHKANYPQGHNRSLGKNCYYDDVDDSFYCTFERE